jgi:hypothetical protein
VLLVAAGLMIRTLWNLRDVNPGFDASNLLTARLSSARRTSRLRNSKVAFTDTCFSASAPCPACRSAGATDRLPLQDGSTQPVAVEGSAEQDMAHQPEVSVRMLTSG